ncbi:ComEA family DNA-binding protein [Trinickia soli]|uniref:Competence protein ComE n=1 Tax=Trinickia soli TaxID=380675 RepID=A0A2N7W655_9BURK|nr:helix-hairpin-helix domain-containing protein [Trinickia soli]KAA0091101.1 helix-hairpin-helix domain-containing protein [Paraburkholderia sp. T12-10]PMS24869.1 competence protein ComE [Trinickia soli]CAB3645130.1 hypothetical protein LMG24076_00564 [Trinickia soli]
MLKKLALLLAALVMSISAVFAATVEVNTADQATLEALSGLGPVKSKAIIDERAKGPFKDADDLVNRVKGLGVKSVTKLEAQGLTINHSSAPPTGSGAKSKASPSSKAPAVQPSAQSSMPSPAASPASNAAAPASNAYEAKSKSKKKSAKTKAASGT